MTARVARRDHPRGRERATSPHRRSWREDDTVTDPVHELLAAAVKGSARLENALERVWTSHQHHPHYDDTSNPKEPPVSVLDTIRADFAAVIDKAEQDAAKVERYESEPLVQGIIGMIETVPVAREILTPVLDGLNKLASMAPVAPAAADPAAPAADPNPQTYVAQ